MNANASANAYKQQQIMTAPPEELTLMLYNGAIRFVSESILALDAGDLQKSHNQNMRAQDIVKEFMCTLDMQYELSQGWFQLYEYIEYRLIQANLKKDKEMLVEAKGLLTELRDAWFQAIKQLRPAQAVGR
ncbi:MAG: fliS [Firmicutes bacterium]|nr:fliS [Bacillota bacterium]